MKIRTISFAIILYSIFISSISCSSIEEIPFEDKLQKVLDEGIMKYDARGVSAAIIFSDNKMWKGTSGISHDTVIVKSDMLFAIGSITKCFVAALTLKLVEEGKLSLEDPLSEWLPNYPYVNNEITIRQLLNHTSGIYMFWSNQKIWDDLKKDRTKIWTPEEVLSYIKEPYFEPGEGHRYSNTNYLLMAMIIEKATGSNLSTEFRERFWEPLGIKQAFLSIEEEIPEHQAHVFGDNFNKDGSCIDLTFLPRTSHESITFGSAGLFMIAEELAHWCFTLFEGNILGPQSMNNMLDFKSGKDNYGLGVGLFEKRTGSGEKLIGHSGANIGTSAYMLHLPEHHFSVVVMINDFNHKCSHAIAKKLITTVLKELDVIGFVPYYSFRPMGLFLFPICGTLTLIVIFLLRKRRRMEAAN